MFAFIGACVVTMVVYSVAWRGMSPSLFLLLYIRYQSVLSCLACYLTSIAKPESVFLTSTSTSPPHLHYTNPPKAHQEQTKKLTERKKAHQSRTKTQDLARRKAFQNRASLTNPHYLTARTAVSSITPINGSSLDGSGYCYTQSERVGVGLGLGSEMGGERGVVSSSGDGFGTEGLVELPVHGIGAGLGGSGSRFGEGRGDLL